MDKVNYWEVFEKTGSVEAYLAYCCIEAFSSNSSVELEELEKKGIDGDK